MLSRAWRHRLGFTVGGAVASSRNAYSRRLHTTRPCAFLISTSGSEPSRPRRASSKSCSSAKSSAASAARWAARVAGVASLGSTRSVGERAVDLDLDGALGEPFLLPPLAIRGEVRRLAVQVEGGLVLVLLVEEEQIGILAGAVRTVGEA